MGIVEPQSKARRRISKLFLLTLWPSEPCCCQEPQNQSQTEYIIPPMENFRTAASRPSNLKRAEWKRKCREQLSAHICKAHQPLQCSSANIAQDGRLVGIMIDPSQVRLKTHPDDVYTWQRMEENEHLFLKNMSDHSTGALKELCDGIGKSFAATGNRATRELQVGSVQETVCALISRF